MRRYLITAAVATVLSASMLPSHAAVNTVVAVPGSFQAGFATTEVIISKSAPANFINADAAGHTFTIKKPSGGYWLNVTAEVGEAAPINASNVPNGKYQFYCIPHANMVGTVTIQA